ncbi:hypothetical protein HGO38_02530 [Rhizobium sp. CG5]|uniref:hypothetical protein n=1 Tax=Rhizobium sp. CG5 TaxID=2726076 RepID=UPI002033F2A6|nr:hypothetical protein [Rhizobium sp. CG5]MCM2472349.1 hypothetical protein [Rhizobium sp. CG5]
MTEAAELAFLSNRTSDAMSQIKSVVVELSEYNEELWPTVRLALLGAVNKQAQTELTSEGILLRCGGKTKRATWIADAKIADHAAGALVAAALASGNLDQTLELLARPNRGSDDITLGFIAVMKTAETDVLPLFGFRKNDDGTIERMFDTDGRKAEPGWIAAVARVQDYAARVRVLRTDRIRWSQMRPRAPLLDWTLLLMFLGIRRSCGKKHLDELVRRCGTDGLAPKLATYLRDLANEIEGGSDGNRGIRPKPPAPDGYGSAKRYQTMPTQTYR